MGVPGAERLVRGDTEGEDGNLGRSGGEGALKQSLDRQRQKREEDLGAWPPRPKGCWFKSRVFMMERKQAGSSGFSGASILFAWLRLGT